MKNKLTSLSKIILVCVLISLFNSCNHNNSYDELQSEILSLKAQNDSLIQVISEYDYNLFLSLQPVSIMKNSFFSLGDSAVIHAVMGVNPIPNTEAIIYLGKDYKNGELIDIYDTIKCDGTYAKIPVYGDRLGEHTVYGMYELNINGNKGILRFEHYYDVIEK